MSSWSLSQPRSIRFARELSESGQAVFALEPASERLQVEGNSRESIHAYDLISGLTPADIALPSRDYDNTNAITDDEWRDRLDGGCNADVCRMYTATMPSDRVTQLEISLIKRVFIFANQLSKL